jgi:hypothetical protein
MLQLPVDFCFTRCHFHSLPPRFGNEPRWNCTCSLPQICAPWCLKKAFSTMVSRDSSNGSGYLNYTLSNLPCTEYLPYPCALAAASTNRTDGRHWASDCSRTYSHPSAASWSSNTNTTPKSQRLSHRVPMLHRCDEWFDHLTSAILAQRTLVIDGRRAT